jgi:multidrug efflux pump subunit AcrA (membrane-fusion protein)
LKIERKRVLPVLLAMFSAGCEDVQRGVAPETALATPEVRVETLVPRVYQSTITTFGVVEGLEEVDIASEISGTVSSVLVNEGDAVEAGQLPARAGGPATGGEGAG